MTGAEEVRNGHGGIVVVEDAAGIAGRVVYWRLQGTVEHDVLVDAWTAAGLDEAQLPETPTYLQALRRVLGDVQMGRSKRRLLVRPLASDSPGFALVNEEAQGRDLDHAIIFTVVVTNTYDAADIPELDVQPGLAMQADGEAKLDALRAGLQRAFAQACMEHDTKNVSRWLSGLLPRLQAVGLRDKGGVYFVPRDKLPQWDAIVGVLREVSEHAVFQLPAMQTKDAVDAILDAITTEAAALAERIEGELNGTDLGTRALRTRIRYCEEAGSKLAAYENLLDTKLDDIADRIDQLKANVSQALIMAEAEEDANAA